MAGKGTDIIDLRNIFRTLWKKKLVFFIVIPIVAVLASIGAGGTLGNLASSIGLSLDNMQSTDAIYPLLYPDLMEDNGFVVSLWNIKVTDIGDSIHTTYYDYLKNHQKQVWWAPARNKVMALLGSDKDVVNINKKGGAEFDPYRLNKTQDDIVKIIQSNIKISIDKQTSIITISIKDQDPLICKTLADTLTAKLQDFITDYRTRKARVDVDYYQKLTNEAKKDYEAIREKYVQAAKAKVQERTPAFTMIKGSSVPIKPAGPKRMIFVAGMIFLSFICTAFYLVRKELFGL